MKLNRFDILLSLGLVLLLAAACVSPAPRNVTPTTQPPDHPSAFLRVQGRDIVDASGQPILLRGINMDTYYYSFTWDPAASLTYASQEDIQYLDSLGVTAIRLGLHWRYFDTSLGFDLIDAYLDWCEQAGIYVILDMHVVPPEDDILEGRMWDDPAAQQQFLDLWTTIAARYADRTIIAGYDLYNEPLPPTADQWWDLVERARAAIRAVDANHILFVENPLIEDGGFRLIADPNVVYSFHDYEPFVVSHAGAGWVGDSPVPDDSAYPGPALVGTEWVDWSPDAAVFTGQAGEWLYWDSGVLTVPTGVEFATLKLAVYDNIGAAWFDDLELTFNGAPQEVFNPGMEDASNEDASQPANWFFWSDSGFSGEWSREHAHSGTYSLKISSDGDGFGVWTQSEWIFTAPLFRAQPGDTFRVRGWIYAPQNNGGGLSLGLDYLNGVYENYDRARLLEEMKPYIDWGIANNVPLHVGEFGAMSVSPGDSRYNLAEDKISVMNEANLHWHMWTYRESSPPGFGLFFGSDVDEGLEEILRQGLGTPGGYSATALRIADYLLDQQNADGAIPDAPNGETVNLDSNMEYALIGLAAAYHSSRAPRYLNGLEKGIRWLADREEMTDPRWRGSWFYAYSSAPPYDPIPISPDDPAILDVRGVDATSALFAYLLYLYSTVSGSNALAQEYESHARAALDFLLMDNVTPDGFFDSSWQLSQSDNVWRLWHFRYAADQGDVYLGMRAGCLLYADSRYCYPADFLKANVPAAFFDPASGRYAIGMNKDGSLETEMEGFDGIFPQGYLAWVFGDNESNRAAFDWLTACLQDDGSLACFDGDPRFSLSAAIYAMSASALGEPLPAQTLNWLTAVPCDPADGGIRDTANPASEKFPNVAGFSVAALLEFPAFLDE